MQTYILTNCNLYTQLKLNTLFAFQFKVWFWAAMKSRRSCCRWFSPILVDSEIDRVSLLGASSAQQFRVLFSLHRILFLELAKMHCDSPRNGSKAQIQRWKSTTRPLIICIVKTIVYACLTHSRPSAIVKLSQFCLSFSSSYHNLYLALAIHSTMRSDRRISMTARKSQTLHCCCPTLTRWEYSDQVSANCFANITTNLFVQTICNYLTEYMCISSFTLISYWLCTRLRLSQDVHWPDKDADYR